MDKYGVRIVCCPKEEAERMGNIFKKHIRKEDRVELETAKQDVYEAVKESIFLSDECYMALNKEGAVLCIFGYVKNEHLIWALGTDALYEYTRALVLNGKQYINTCVEKYGYVQNIIHEDNTRALRFIGRCGADFIARYGAFIHFRIGG